jgi:hypothetical protein
LGSWFATNAQINQLVKGSVRTEENQPVSQAQIQLVGVDSSYQQISNAAGEFEILAFPGRYIIKISGEGYSKTEEELLVVAGKANVISIELKALPVSLKDIEIRAPQNIEEVPGAYAISIEKTMRVPANFFDPVRMAISLPGVVPTNDQSNSISIKGYSPNALSWRLQGLDIVNPNHLANAGTLSDKPMANGGGVSILSSQVLDKTSFYSGALPIQYGNALSGAMDMSLRAGNKSKREHTVQASLIGIDLATEGPMGKVSGDGGDAKSSYLINYRYSTVGLLSLAGVNFGDEKINFQDLTFHLDFDQKKGRHLSVFGFGGLSYNRFDRKPETEWETEKDRYDIDFDGKVFGLGFSSTLFSGSKSNLKLGAVVSGQEQTRKSQSQLITVPAQYVYRENYLSERTLISSSLNYAYRFSPAVSILTGVIATSFNQKLNVETVTPLYFDDHFPNLSGEVNGILWQPYFNSEIKTRFADINLGLRYVNFDYNGSNSIEPRASIATNLFKGRLMLAYGLTSQIQQTQIYLASNNSNSGLNQAHQYSISYKKILKNDLSIGLAGFYHQLFNVAVSGDAIPFSVLNQMDEFVYTNLSTVGFGKNRGVELSLEKKFSNNLYFLGGASWYESGASGSNKVYYTSRYSGRYTYTASGGKEWSKRKNKAFGIHARALYLGGLRQPTISESGSAAFGTTVYDDENLYSLKLPDYYRLDLRASWRKNKPGYTRTISIDIQNVTGQKNTAFYYYDTFTQKVETKYQLGLIPVLVYRVDF